MRSVPPPGSTTGWRMSPPLATRSSSMRRMTSRAARPTSSSRDLWPSSSSTTTRGITASLSGKANSDSGSEMSTDVSSTTRRVTVASTASPSPSAGDGVVAGAAVDERDRDGSRSVTGTPRDRAPRGPPARSADPVPPVVDRSGCHPSGGGCAVPGLSRASDRRGCRSGQRGPSKPVAAARWRTPGEVSSCVHPADTRRERAVARTRGRVRGCGHAGPGRGLRLLRHRGG